MQIAEATKGEGRYFFGRVGEDVWKAREILKQVSDVEVLPTVFGWPYVVFKAEVEEFQRVREQFRSVLWIDALDKRTLFYGKAVMETVRKPVDFLNADEVQEYVEPLFQMYLRGVQDIRF